MKNYFKTTGLVLKRHAFKEADLMVTIITQDQGKITCLAKNARRLTNKLCGKLEPFYQVQLESIAGQTFNYIKEVDVLSSHQIGVMSLGAQNSLYFLAELTHRLTAEEQETEAIFELWQNLMDCWPENKHKADALLHAGVIKLLTELGFMASWQHCQSSHEKLNLDQAIYLNSENVSLSHLPQASNEALSPTLIKWVNFMQSYPLSDILRVRPSEQEKEQVWKLLQSLIYPLLSQPMKSERFLVMG